MTAAPPAVLFDVDGTLVESNYFHVVAWWRAFRDEGEDVAMARIQPLIGMGSEDLVRRLLGRDHAGAAEGHSRQFAAFADELRPFPGTAELLRAVKHRGAKVVLATSAQGEALDHLVRVIGADDAIDGAVSKADVERSKPAPDVFEAALEQFGSDPARTLVVGDTPWDVEAAGKLGLGVVAVLTGGWSRDRLLESGAVAVYDDVAELLRELDRSPLAAVLDT